MKGNGMMRNIMVFAVMLMATIALSGCGAKSEDGLSAVSSESTPVASPTGTPESTPTASPTEIPEATSASMTPDLESLKAGLYDAELELLYSWDKLVKKGWIEVSKNSVVGSNSEKLQGILVITSSVTSIESNAFKGCSNISNIEIPNSVTSIGQTAFEGCSSLSSIEIPSSVTSIGYLAFVDCIGLERIKVDSENPVYDSRNDCNGIIETESNELLVGCENTIIPSNVTSIVGYAFYNCSSLSNIEIPSSVTSIGENAFLGCSSLNSIKFPSSVTSIGDYAFCYCSSLSSIEIPSSVTSIGAQVFYGCSSSTYIYCHADSKPRDWSSAWDYACDATVVWGYTGA